MWSIDKIAALAPDPSTEKRGRGLATLKNWTEIGYDGQYLWGMCKGSGSRPYQTQIDTQAPAFSCTCPMIYNPPCKHSLGLFLLWAENPPTANSQAPDWVDAWIQKRLAQATKKSVGKEKTPEELAKSQQEKNKRWEKRLALMQDGIQGLEQWLTDLVGQGAANAEIFSSTFWEHIAARLVDAKLPRLGTYLKETYQLIHKHSDWANLLTQRIGHLYLVVRAFQKQATLSEPLLDELFAQAGLSIQKSELLAEQATQKGEWAVMSVEMLTDAENRSYRKVWLAGLEQAEYACVIDYVFGNQQLDQYFMVGAKISAELVYYPSASPQRAIVANFETQAQPTVWDTKELKTYPHLDAFLENFAQAVATNPFLETLPCLFEGLVPYLHPNKEFVFLDTSYRILPIPPQAQKFMYRLFAISAGKPLTIFGEWANNCFRPISFLHEGEILLLQEQIIPFVKNVRI
jgi:hypothetical protein